MICALLAAGTMLVAQGLYPRATEERTIPEPEQLIEEAQDLPAPWLRLRRVEEALIKAYLQREPWMKFERGLTGGSSGLGRFDPDAVADWSFTLRSTAADLEAIRPDELPESRRFDHAWLSAWVRYQTLLAYSQAPQRWNPVYYVERAHRVLRALADSHSEDPNPRRWQSEQALEQIPELWETARRGLVAPSSEFSADAVRRLLDLGSYIDRDLARAFADADWSEDHLELFATRKAAALEGSLRFRNWLSHAPMKSGGPVSVMGAASWKNVVSELVGVDVTIPELKSRLFRNLSVLDRRLGPHRPLVAAPDEQLTQAAMSKRMRMASALAMDLTLRARLFENTELPLGELQFDVKTLRGHGIPLSPARLRPGRGMGQRLLVETTGTAWPPDMQRTRSALLSAPAQRVMAIRYGYPGESLLRTMLAGHSSRAQQNLWNRATLEGWGLYMADLLSRIDWVANPLLEDEGYRIELDRTLLIEMVRLLAAIELHAEAKSVAEAAEAFASRSGFDEETALHETRAVMHDPLTGIGYIAYLELLRLEDDLGLRAAAGSPSNLERLLAQPCASPQDIRTMIAPRGER